MTSDGCSEVVDFLADYLEHKLPARQQQQLETHLESCPSCVSQLRTYRTTVSLLRGLCDEDLPAELRASAQAFLHGGGSDQGRQ